MKIYAEKMGFSTENSGSENSEILNELLRKYDDVEVGEKGVYSVAEAIEIGSNTRLSFAEGVFLKREESKTETSYVLINKGAYTRMYDENITVCGLNIICNGVQSSNPTAKSKSVIAGLRGHIAFFYVKNLVIKNFTALDLPPKDFGIHICTFYNILIEDVKIEGRKDAVHLGRGMNFVIRGGDFKTFDDPVALNAHDYASSNPQLGWIENGLIENCIDRDDYETTGFFCRILAGSWCEWKKGMKIQNSDTVISNGRLYRALMKPDGKIYESLTAPAHEAGMQVIDGINWVFVQNEVFKNCGCKNITFKNIVIEKNRPVAFSMHFDNDNFSRSVYPGSAAPVQENITFENIKVSGDVPVFMYAVTPVSNIKIKDSDLGEGTIEISSLKNVGEYPIDNFAFENTKVPEFAIAPGRKVTVEEK